MARLVSILAACLILISSTTLAHAQQGPPAEYMGIAQYTVVYDNLAQYQQAVISQMPTVTDSSEQQMLTSSFCMATSMLVMLDHVSRTIGFSYGALEINDQCGVDISTQLLCTYYEYDLGNLEAYAGQLDQMAAATTGQTQELLYTLLDNTVALYQLIAAQGQEHCPQ
ncbi:MAG: hypothetical protein D6E12_08305 [Desulfovibrio sp.]|nr:MAG: hypothetical protein D6E12_08305 [Desulfovibrio sp.]